MKKVLSVAMASAMVLGMGANAFAITYNTGSNETAEWPTGFAFDGALFVTDKNGDIITDATTAINDNETVNFEPGDVIWMPLYAEDQKVYDAGWSEGKDEVEAVSNVKVGTYNKAKTISAYYSSSQGFLLASDASKLDVEALKAQGYVFPTDPKDGQTYTVTNNKLVSSVENVPAAGDKITYNGVERTVSKNSVKYYINGTKYADLKALNEALANGNYTESQVNVTVNLDKIDSTDDSIGKPVVDTTVDYGHYTGNIDKNWSINLIEKSTGVAELIEKAELYKATATDYASYSKYTDEIMPNAVYLKITLEDEWKTTSSETLKYYVYVANNKSNTQKTNEVWVSGKYENTDVREVSFDWTNDASKAGLWKVKEGNGIAVFDFADKAFFSVKMYEGETMYLDLGTAYDKAIAGEMDAEADSFYKFDNTNANFARTGELIIVSDDSSLVPYEIDADGNFVKVDAEYVENYAVAHTNQKVNGFVFNTKQLGNYVLSTEELGEEEEVTEEPTTEEPAVEEPVVEEPVVEEETNKPNPNTGAEDFVGLAVSLAVVSVAAAGALALKK